jgi:hypothetical protein
MLTSGYDPVRDSMSELGAVDVASRHAMNVSGFMILGATILAFAAGHRLCLRPGWLTSAASM